jgi:hypothetical protein
MSHLCFPSVLNTAFLMPAENISDRLALVVTLILALLAFQYTINDKLPNTGCVVPFHILLKMRCLFTHPTLLKKQSIYCPRILLAGT